MAIQHGGDTNTSFNASQDETEAGLMNPLDYLMICAVGLDIGPDHWTRWTHI